MKRVAIIILCWNSRKHLPNCLKSVSNQTYSHDHYDVVVVDNASADETVDFIEMNYSNIFLIKNKKNLGYAAGNNVGLRYAYKKNYDYFVILNDDMKVASNWLEELVKTADNNQFVGIVQSKILFMQEEYRINTIGNPLHPLAFSWSGGYKQLSSNFLVNKPITIASGACLLVKRAVIDKIGFFDEKMFMYHEDVDFSWRAHLAGFDTWLAADSKAFHNHNFSMGGMKFFWSERNRLINYFSHLRWWSLAVFLPAFFITELVLIAYAFALGWGGYKLKSYFSFFINIPYVLAKRRRSRKLRIISDREIMKLMTFALDFEDVNNWMLKYLYNPFSFVYFKIAKFIIF